MLSPISEKSSTPHSSRSSQTDIIQSWASDHWADDKRDYSPVSTPAPSVRISKTVNDPSPPVSPISSRSCHSYHSSIDSSSASTPSIHTLPISVRTASEHIRGRPSSSSSTASSIIDLGSDEKHVVLSLHYPGLQKYTHPGFVSGRTTYFSPGGETRTRSRRPIPQSAYRSPFFSSGHDHIEDSTSAADLSTDSHSARLNVSVSAATSVAEASKHPPARLNTVDDQSINASGGIVDDAEEAYSPRSLRRRSSERSRGTFFGGGVDSRALRSTQVASTTIFDAYPSSHHYDDYDDHGLQEPESVSKRSQCMSILRKCKTGAETIWTKATGTRQGEEETGSGQSRSRLSVWKAYQSRSYKSTAPTASRFDLRKRLKSRWHHGRHSTDEDHTSEYSLETIPD